MCITAAQQDRRTTVHTESSKDVFGSDLSLGCLLAADGHTGKEAIR